ncbi:MAG: hypothetical protein WC867_01070 [Candidatus Pacearchaeota archaeon]|jgi:hypothetical protein
MKYLIKINYSCEKIDDNEKIEGKWFIIDNQNLPILGIINHDEFAGGPLPNHNCKKHYDRQSCELDSSCYHQEIQDIMPFDEILAKTLEAKLLE